MLTYILVYAEVFLRSLSVFSLKSVTFFGFLLHAQCILNWLHFLRKHTDLVLEVVSVEVELDAGPGGEGHGTHTVLAPIHIYLAGEAPHKVLHPPKDLVIDCAIQHEHQVCACVTVH